MSSPVIELHNLAKYYGDGDSQVRALDGVDLRVEQGEFVAIMGASGSGKSTMMNLLGCLDSPTLGDFLINGINVKEMTENQLAYIRNRYIGFVFQAFNLIPRMTAQANVELPMAYAGVSPRERKARSTAALEMVGLAQRAKHMPNQLSGGQQQRVAVARSLVNAPALILADEPTGNLDSQSTADVLDIFDSLHAQGRTIVLITHEDEVAERAQRVLRMTDGKIVSDTLNRSGTGTRSALNRSGTGTRSTLNQAAAETHGTLNRSAAGTHADTRPIPVRTSFQQRPQQTAQELNPTQSPSAKAVSS